MSSVIRVIMREWKAVLVAEINIGYKQMDEIRIDVLQLLRIILHYLSDFCFYDLLSSENFDKFVAEKNKMQ